ncbi:zinc carboxypeptidase-like [Plodia interpunctella]|uniref:zinc carboxypeptidase-like n=1 Tax=Plodia interpunctella TaxID=58824 RepID=UPI002367D33B|nr:zinc carboxypeptidase-like [Plodia interpunctella]XP_053613738.1 zinc carboxypeptidase-like [Plodia interpunctella]
MNIVVVLLAVIALSGAKQTFNDYKVYKVVPKNEVQVQQLNDLKKDGYDFWTDIFEVDNDVRIMVSPAQEKVFVNYTRTVGMQPEITVANVQELIDAQMIPADGRSETLGSFSWNKYHNLDEIHAWLDELADLYPGVVTTVTIGQSYESRPIKGVLIDFKNSDREGTPLVGMIEGGIHAREWISPATVTWIIKEFLTSDDADVRFLAETFVWHIFPVVNPDGYVYTFTNNRMWRKNRNPTNYVSTCANADIGNGIDLNRNFDFVWMSIGASNNPCAETYAGPSASSELEAQAIIRYVNQLKATGNVIYYFAFHSYSQMILVPYSHVSDFGVLEAENYGDMYEIAIRGAEKLTARHGTPYAVGTSTAILYAVSGSSFDWAKGVANFPIVYLFELRDVGNFGFLLPTSQIIPNNEEIMDCLIEMDKTTRQLRYYSGTVVIYRSIMSVITSLVFLAVFK